ncbi:MAG: SCP2 sterol-binding domain-containing protein [Paracoccaceae bacterium]
MNPVLQEAIEMLTPKVSGILEGRVRLIIKGEGALLLTREGASVDADTDAAVDVTMTASEAVFRGIFSGDTNPVVAAMTGRLKLNGSMARALKVGEIMTS